MSTISTRFARFRPSGETLLWGAVVLNAELFTLIFYFATSNHSSGELRYLLYPFIWINVALFAVWKTNPIARSDRDRTVGVAVAVGYFLILGYAGGLFGLSPSMPGMPATGFRIAWLPPGWGPALLYHGDLLRLSILPFKLVGYLALAYLVYATVLDAAGSAISGILGLFSCVSCTWPVVASLVTGIAGAGSGFAAMATSGSYDISTVVFVVTVVLLYWRPTIR
ncbi:hypothetical protein SAMN05421858_0815 [Haladaptatus litoreus]|uniref:Uncharacterized protein n=1 Tax=Haladaptatus litoreus TaxID=553468 RepID=A0A1N6WPD9_9EURY|nr:hypothetical protein [Haladaptatus litoreus]SIQ91905.1 hypothetical protein SAMN05421858_0815 [Haladaptatus litoreus]